MESKGLEVEIVINNDTPGAILLEVLRTHFLSNRGHLLHFPVVKRGCLGGSVSRGAATVEEEESLLGRCC